MKKLITVAVLAASVAVTGCAKNGAKMSAADLDLKRELELKSQEVEQLQSSKSSLEKELQGSQAEIQAREKALEQARNEAEKARAAQLAAERTAGDSGSGHASDDLFPPNAKVNECYARVFVPATYRTETERILKQEAAERISVEPPRFEWGTEQVVVKEASKRIEVVPAEYGWKEERMLVKPASKELVHVPAEFKWTEEKLLVKPAHTAWKKGRGPVEKVDNATGEIMCLVEVPAVYETVKKKVLVKAAHTKEVEIPAEYEMVKTKVVTKPETTREIEIPAEYGTVKVRKQVSPAKENRIEIPAEYDTVTKSIPVTEDHLEWRPVLCETNMTATTMTAIQRALKTKGFNPGPIDGIYGPQTRNAVRSFQKANGQPTGGLTLETVKALGV